MLTYTYLSCKEDQDAVALAVLGFLIMFIKFHTCTVYRNVKRDV